MARGVAGAAAAARDLGAGAVEAVEGSGGVGVREPRRPRPGGDVDAVEVEPKGGAESPSDGVAGRSGASRSLGLGLSDDGRAWRHHGRLDARWPRPRFVWVRELHFPHPRRGTAVKRGRDHGRESLQLNAPTRLGCAAASHPNGAELLPRRRSSTGPAFAQRRASTPRRTDSCSARPASPPTRPATANPVVEFAASPAATSARLL